MATLEAYKNALNNWGAKIIFSGYIQPPKNGKKKKKQYYKIIYTFLDNEFTIIEPDQLRAYDEALEVLEYNASQNHWIPLSIK